MEAAEILKRLEEELGPTLLEGELKPRPAGKERIFLRIPRAGIRTVASALINRLGARLSTVSCVEKASFYELIYHFALDREGIIVSVRTEVPKSEPEIDSLVGVTKGSLFIEREVRDLFGVGFVGHPNLRRLLLSDDWPKKTHPLRKGLGPKTLEVSVKEAVPRPPEGLSVIPIGPFHPALKETELFKFYVEGEKVKDVEMRLGYIHRAIEKLSEGLTLEQVPFLVERICGICSNVHPLCFVQAVEDIARIEVPERASYIRVIIAELERIHSHLLWLGVAGHLIGFDTLLMWAWRQREPVLDLFELITGNRQNYAMQAVGGVRKDIKPEHVPKILETLKMVEKETKKMAEMLEGDPVTKRRLRGVGILTKEQATDFCVVGPTARGSGLKIDVRKDHPYAAYGELSFDVPVYSEGDNLARTLVRVEEILQSVELLRQVLFNLPKGEIRAEFKNVPPGEGIGTAEAPRGEDIHYVRTDGRNMPLRHKIRAPTYVNLQALSVMLPGYSLADAIITLGSIDPCFSCTERVAVVDLRTGTTRHLMEEELVELSRKHGA